MSTTTVERKLLSAKEVGLIIGRHARTVIIYAQTGAIAHVNQGGQYQFTPEQVDEYLASKTVPAQTAAKPAKPTRRPGRRYAS